MAPFTEADVAAIIAAPGVPLTANMNPFLEARLQHFAEVEVESQAAAGDGADGSQSSGKWAWELSQLFSQCFGQPPGAPFVRFYREASRRLIDSAYVRDKEVDLSYLLFTQQGGSEELTDETILDSLEK